ncbi:MAG: carbon-nitrogen hydrolase [Planctomycetota bacterium]|nr:carbon-nitrogen hydrolase [Planctomycetota bacterium]
MSDPHADLLRLGLVQTHAQADATANLDHTRALIRRAAEEGAQVVCTQELFLTPYFCQVESDEHFRLAEPIPGPTTTRLGELAYELGVVIVASLFEKRAPGLFHNTAVVFDADGSLVGRYRKMHIPDDPRFYEKYYFTPGDLGFRVFDTQFGRLGVLICWDQWYPEAARLTALAGAEVLIYPTAIGTWQGELELKDAQHDAWRTIQRSHAIANGVFVAAINRVGTEDELDFWGHSFVTAPDGSILAEANAEEAVVVVGCDRAQIDAAREGWPFLRDRRIDAYDGLGERWLGDE